jgi:hypothetical protein
MAPPSKRKHEEYEDPEELTASFLWDLIQRPVGENIGKFTIEMVQNELSLEDFEALAEKLLQFASTEWEKVAIAFDLNPSVNKYQLRPFSIPHACLPPLFLKYGSSVPL